MWQRWTGSSAPWCVVTDRRPEDELLLCCARPRSEPRADRLRCLAASITDWPYVLDSAARHGLIPLLHESMDAVDVGVVEPETLQNLQDQFQRSLLRNLLFTSELLGLLKCFDAAGIPAVPFKGPVLALLAYGSLAHRDMCDLDIVIRRRDFTKALVVLEHRGYGSSVQLHDARIVRAYLARKYAHSAIHPNGTVVDLHWQIIPTRVPVQLDDQLWERLESVQLAGIAVPSFSKEDLLLLLCVHGAKHYWRRLEWLCCLAGLVRNHPGIDWITVFDRAAAWGILRMLLLSLVLARKFAQLELPEAIANRIEADARLARFASRVGERLLAGTERPPGILEEFRFWSEIRERRVDRVRHARELVMRRLHPNVEDRAVLRLPPRLSFLYYLIRPARLCHKYVLTKHAKD
jgi:hypothetical protein